MVLILAAYHSMDITYLYCTNKPHIFYNISYQQNNCFLPNIIHCYYYSISCIYLRCIILITHSETITKLRASLGIKYDYCLLFLDSYICSFDYIPHTTITTIVKWVLDVSPLDVCITVYPIRI
jgi:hypothetical protein